MHVYDQLCCNSSNFHLRNGCHAVETVRSTRSRGNPAIGVEAHRALMIDIPNPRAFMLNIGHGQFQFDVYDMAIYIFSAIESVIRNRQPCLLSLGRSLWPSARLAQSRGCRSVAISSPLEGCNREIDASPFQFIPQIGVTTEALLSSLPRSTEIVTAIPDSRGS